MTEYIASFKEEVDRKYNSIVSKFSDKLTHPQREVETSLGNLVANVFAEIAECNIMFVGAGSIRVKELGPSVTLGDIKACFPYDDSSIRFTITGNQVKKIFAHIP